MQKWSIKSDALLITRSRDRSNSIKRDVATNWLITEICLIIFKDKRLLCSLDNNYIFSNFPSKVKINLKFTNVKSLKFYYNILFVFSQKKLHSFI